ncbi:hypothetical protein BG004_000933 [Podila humilis]|nr:hypothetical protein BG004_000933 [Podila humilis]
MDSIRHYWHSSDLSEMGLSKVRTADAKFSAGRGRTRQHNNTSFDTSLFEDHEDMLSITSKNLKADIKCKRRKYTWIAATSLILCLTSALFLTTIHNGPPNKWFASTLKSQGVNRHHSSRLQERQENNEAPPEAPVVVDPCATLGLAVSSQITYDLVRSCYEHIPYNATESGIVLSTLYTLYRDYYIFLDYAMQPAQQKPYTNPPVDLLAGLDAISRTDYKSDFQFHTDIDLLTNRLNDAHANYIDTPVAELVHCYRHYLYQQPFDLYAPVVDGVQSIRILVDGLQTGLEDCEVRTIDGQPALATIQQWVDKHYGFSKDAGVRLNRALTSQYFNSDELAWRNSPGQYTSRVTLPESQALTYELSCPPSRLYPTGHNQTLKMDWEVYRLISWNDFDSTETFLTQNCYKDTDPALLSEQENEGAGPVRRRVDDDDDTSLHRFKKRLLLEREKKYSWDREHQAAVDMRTETIYPVKRNIKQTTTIPESQENAASNLHDGQVIATVEKEEEASFSSTLDGEQVARISHLVRRQDVDRQIATRLYNGTHTAFYQLNNRPSIGVVVIPTHSVQVKSETIALAEGFQILYDAGVRNVVLDLTANGGGYVNFAYDLVDWMFPDENVTSVYQSDLRSSMSVKALAQADLANDDYESYFNPDSYSDPENLGSTFEFNFFMNDTLTWRVPTNSSGDETEQQGEGGRGRRRKGHGRAQDLTRHVFMNHNLGEFEMGMPWQNEPQRIVALTDGTCGSACGMTLNRLKNRHGIKSYASGGRQGEPLSLFSFAGASVYGLDAIQSDFKSLGVDSPMQPLRYKGIYRVPVMEFYWEGDPIPIEYNPKLYTADFHLDQTPLTARNHELFWEIVAEQHWPDKLADA